ncbi:MAG: hypothetical protein PWP24_363 [Clostridiales bacterium]|nr:hypothetical protein [Clostridiales bacterium]
MSKGAVMIIAAAFCFGCLSLLLYERYRMRKIMNRLNEMMDQALEGTYQEKHYDESLLSAVEARWNRYLNASLVSARNLADEKNKIKEMLADISHQTKTPISNILLYTQLLEEQIASSDNNEYVTALREQAEKLCFLITDLVKLSRLEAGVFMLHPKEQEVNSLLLEVVRRYLPAAEKKGLVITKVDTNAEAVFDYKWTLEALSNLLDNAIKYTDSGGSVEILVTEYEQFCCIAVHDTGIGIAEEEQANIFCRFYRGKRVYDKEGVGIGLYLVRQILSSQDGYIKVSSVEGKGSIFSMFLKK